MIDVTQTREKLQSFDLRGLRALRLVKSRRVGKFVYYSLDDAHIALLLRIGLTHQGHGDALSAPSAASPAPAERTG